MSVIKTTALLTGAGFSQSFGGHLADQMWAAIFNQPEMEKYPGLRKVLLHHLNYEDAYSEIVWGVKGQFSGKQRQAFLDAVGRAYDEMDSTISQDIQRPIAACNLFIKLFAGTGKDERGFIFTLNHDLLIEKFLSIPKKNHARR